MRVLFKDLLPLPKRERPVVRRKKTFQTHLLTSDENQEIIHTSDVESQRKEKLAEAYKKFLENEKEKKKELAKKKENNSKTRQYKGKEFASSSKGQSEGGKRPWEGKGYNK